MRNANKEIVLDEKLRELHCRPMVKMFMFFNSDEMMAVATPEFDEIKYTSITRVQLNEYSAKINTEYDFSK